MNKRQSKHDADHITKAQVLEAATRGDGCLGRSHADEPVFVLCGRDRAAVPAIRAWIQRAKSLGASREKIEGANLVAERMTAWQSEHDGGKVPGL